MAKRKTPMRWDGHRHVPIGGAELAAHRKAEAKAKTDAKLEAEAKRKAKAEAKAAKASRGARPKETAPISSEPVGVPDATGDGGSSGGGLRGGGAADDGP